MTLSSWWTFYIQELKKIFSYRANFWILFFSTVGGEILIAFILWSALFSTTPQDTYGGLDFHNMVKYYILSSFLGRIVRGAENFSISTEIYDGSLTRYLIYPGSYLLYKLGEKTAHYSINIFQFVMGMCLCYFIYNYLNINFVYISNLIMALALVTIAAYFNFIIMSGVELVAFWADNVWSLSVMVRFITSFLSGMMLPLTLYPESIQKIIGYTPFPSMIYVPIQLATGQAGLPEFISGVTILLQWSALALGAWYLVWKMGLKQYTGVGQ